jgi:hypothetical protein
MDTDTDTDTYVAMDTDVNTENNNILYNQVSTNGNTNTSNRNGYNNANGYNVYTNTSNQYNYGTRNSTHNGYSNSNSNRIINGIFYGVLSAMVIISTWVFWAMFVYKWDLDRIGNKMLLKYSAQNQNLLSSNTYFNYANVVLADDKSYATADMQVKDQMTQAVKSSINVKYKIVSDCSDIDLNCIMT